MTGKDGGDLQALEKGLKLPLTMCQVGAASRLGITENAPGEG